jgi:hypothetical protein
VRDQFFHLLAGSGALYRDGKRHLLEGCPWTLQTELIAHVEAASHVHLGIFDWHVIEWREPRQLGEQSKGRPRQEVIERSRTAILSTSLRRFVGLKTMPANPALEMYIF